MVLGGERLTKLLGAKLVSEERKNDETYKLWKTKEKYTEAGGNVLAWVEVECPSTGTHYFIDVKPDVTSATEAVASTWPGEKADTYEVEQHT